MLSLFWTCVLKDGLFPLFERIDPYIHKEKRKEALTGLRTLCSSKQSVHYQLPGRVMASGRRVGNFRYRRGIWQEQ